MYTWRSHRSRALILLSIEPIPSQYHDTQNPLLGEQTAQSWAKAWFRKPSAKRQAIGSFLPSLGSVMLPKSTQFEGADTFMKSG
jgi:hypothetical protein